MHNSVNLARTTRTNVNYRSGNVSIDSDSAREGRRSNVETQTSSRNTEPESAQALSAAFVPSRNLLRSLQNNSTSQNTNTFAKNITEDFAAVGDDLKNLITSHELSITDKVALENGMVAILHGHMNDVMNGVNAALGNDAEHLLSSGALLAKLGESRKEVDSFLQKFLEAFEKIARMSNGAQVELSKCDAAKITAKAKLAQANYSKALANYNAEVKKMAWAGFGIDIFKFIVNVVFEVVAAIEVVGTLGTNAAADASFSAQSLITVNSCSQVCAATVVAIDADSGVTPPAWVKEMSNGGLIGLIGNKKAREAILDSLMVISALGGVAALKTLISKAIVKLSVKSIARVVTEEAAEEMVTIVKGVDKSAEEGAAKTAAKSAVTVEAAEQAVAEDTAEATAKSLETSTSHAAAKEAKFLATEEVVLENIEKEAQSGAKNAVISVQKAVSKVKTSIADAIPKPIKNVWAVAKPIVVLSDSGMQITGTIGSIANPSQERYALVAGGILSAAAVAIANAAMKAEGTGANNARIVDAAVGTVFSVADSVLLCSFSDESLSDEEKITLSQSQGLSARAMRSIDEKLETIKNLSDKSYKGLRDKFNAGPLGKKMQQLRNSIPASMATKVLKTLAENPRMTLTKISREFMIQIDLENAQLNTLTGVNTIENAKVLEIANMRLALVKKVVAEIRVAIQSIEAMIQNDSITSSSIEKVAPELLKFSDKLERSVRDAMEERVKNYF